jgi:dolichol-phosphate mannosyltransferase
VWSLVFYSLAGSKRAGYILPVMPPLALALGCYVDFLVHALRITSERLAVLRQQASALTVRLAALVMAAGLGLAVIGLPAGYLKLGSAIVLVGVATLSFLLVRWFARSRQGSMAWGACGAATFAAVFAALYFTLPGYARRFSLRGQVKPLAEISQDLRLPIISYPRRWDSVSFYLGRDDVRVYSPVEREQLIADLRQQTRTLAFIKSERALDELLQCLPGSLEFVPQGRQGTVAVGWIRHRRNDDLRSALGEQSLESFSD